MKRILIVLLTAVMSVTALQSVNAAAPEEGQTYTDISAVDAGGKAVALSSVVGKGKWVLVDFWATWCGPCRAEIPYLKAAYKRYASKGLVIYSVSLDRNAENWASFVEEKRLKWINVIDDGTASDIYKIKYLPTIFLISPDGRIVANGLRGEKIEETVSKIFE